ncbi:MAG: methyltransferase domain-containing protein [Candidatus Hadarchaeota archaeon]
MRAVLGNLVKLIETDGSEKRALDVGCGTGNILGKLLPMFDETIGFDLSLDMLERAGRKWGDREDLELISGRASRLPFSEDSFDLVSAYSVFHHLPDLSDPISEISRVLKCGGIFYMDHEPVRRENPGVKVYTKFCEFLRDELRVSFPPYGKTEKDRHFCDYQIHNGDNAGIPKARIVRMVKNEGFSILAEKEYLGHRTDESHLVHTAFSKLVDDEWILVCRMDEN